MKMPIRAALPLALVSGLALAAEASEYPKLVGDGHFEMRFDVLPQSDDPDNERLDVNLHGDANLGFYFTRELSIQSTLKVESVRDPREGRDRFLSGTGLYLEQLYLDYESESFGFYAGKFNPTFGMAWARLPELLIEEFSEEYETTEMVGFGGMLKFGSDPVGRHQINAAAFFADTTFLHRSLLSAPRASDERAARISHLRRRDGGAGNTGKPNNFSATLDGGGFAAAPGFFYHLGLRHLKKGRTEERNETAIAAGAGYRFDLPDGTTLTPLVEFVRFRNFEGERARATSLTAGLTLELDRWNVGIAASRLHIDVPRAEGPNVTNWMAGFNVAREIGNGFEIGAGYRHERVEGVHTDWIRIFVGYHFDFSLPLGR